MVLLVYDKLDMYGNCEPHQLFNTRNKGNNEYTYMLQSKDVHSEGERRKSERICTVKIQVRPLNAFLKQKRSLPNYD